MRYILVFWCMAFIRFLIVGLGMFRFFSFVIECSDRTPLTPL